MSTRTQKRKLLEDLDESKAKKSHLDLSKGQNEQSLLEKLLQDDFQGEILSQIEGKSADFSSQLSKLSSENLCQLWSNVQVLVGQALLNLLESSDCKRSLENLKGAFKLARMCLENQAESTISQCQGLAKTMLLLHQSLLALPPHLDGCKNEICKLCELWLSRNPSQDGDFANFGLNALTFLLQRTGQNQGNVSGK